MPIVEIRETIEIPTIDVNTYIGLDVGVYQKRINLEAGKRHTLMSIDVMNDTFNIPPVSNVTGGLYPTTHEPIVFEVYVSSQPILLTNMETANGFLKSRGPAGADDHILFKQVLYYIPESRQLFKEQMPNETLGAIPTFNWYSPQLFFTLVVHDRFDSLEENTYYQDLLFSLYASVKETNVNSVEYGMGVFREYNDAQTRLLMNQGRMIDQAIAEGTTHPTWLFGGIRPSRMLRGDALADFFVSYVGNESEKTMPTADIRTFLARSRTMQPFNTAFGDLDPVKGDVPDWIRFEVARLNLTSPTRDQFPPMIKLTNGNTSMN